MIIKSENYNIELIEIEHFSEKSTEIIDMFKKVHIKLSDYFLPSLIGIRIFENKNIINSALIGSINGGIGIHQSSQIVENNKIIICCSDTIFNLSIPELDINWKIQGDQSTCFGIYKYQNTFIVHGEMEISRIDNNGKVLWKKSGADIFTTISGKNNFELTNNYIKVSDWNNKEYKFDFNGKILNEK